MTNDELIAWNQRGFIPGPGETEASFRQRTQHSVHTLPREQLQWPQEQLQELFDFKPMSLDVIYSNKGLSLWEGAACWIQDGKATLQLREGFRKGSYWGIYQRSEVLVHEAVHAARVMFEEPENEEFFAYATSSKQWRRVLGPIVRRPWETWLFLGSMMAGMFWEWGFLVGMSVLVVGLWRLISQHVRRNRAARMLMKKLSHPRTVRAVLFRMTDAEIRTLSRGREVQGDNSLRWQLLRAAYFTGHSVD